MGLSFSRPFGTGACAKPAPGVETPGYFRDVPAGQGSRRSHQPRTARTDRSNCPRSPRCPGATIRSVQGQLVVLEGQSYTRLAFQRRGGRTVSKPSRRPGREAIKAQNMIRHLIRGKKFGRYPAILILASDRLRVPHVASQLRGLESRLQPAALPFCRDLWTCSTASEFGAPYRLKAGLRTLQLPSKGIQSRVFGRFLARFPPK